MVRCNSDTEISVFRGVMACRSTWPCDFETTGMGSASAVCGAARGGPLAAAINGTLGAGESGKTVRVNQRCAGPLTQPPYSSGSEPNSVESPTGRIDNRRLLLGKAVITRTDSSGAMRKLASLLLITNGPAGICAPREMEQAKSISSQSSRMPTLVRPAVGQPQKQGIVLARIAAPQIAPVAHHQAGVFAHLAGKCEPQVDLVEIGAFAVVGDPGRETLIAATKGIGRAEFGTKTPS